ncbi:precorrin-2 dehydrogenase/sirohydrochlorin ferrochelatase [Balneicella halophila]|uniref:precorrin-2 dehydrogenase n=1 Tax=Balneicella halophila TaxID=1537566 RepID=A0A7L4URN3_BALHA|nr:bifunctional precorrin-2 dehydrogenase/sirohydrochlorin ferrochelatase [Balneicella halophila]PVX52162.1 precorrin-2 dehydrogenase/sirohydrochlorin ferrochelatase [Balneicella halophila]
MSFYNLSIDIRKQKCVVVGGGRVALRKVRKLCEADAHVVVNALDYLPEFYEKPLASQISIEQSEYSKELLKGATLVFAATSDFQLNQQVCADAKELGILVNSVNGEEYGSFIIPATYSNSILTLAITTDGQAPLLSKELRKYFQEKIENVSTELLEEIVLLRKEMVSEDDEKEKQGLEEKLHKKIKQIINQIERV